MCCTAYAGSTAAYDYLPHFYSRVFSLAWVFYGTSEGAEAVHFGEPQVAGDAKFGVYFVKDGKVRTGLRVPPKVVASRQAF